MFFEISFMFCVNIQYVTAAQGKDAAYLNGVGFPVTEV